jgi:hypothetical protein
MILDLGLSGRLKCPLELEAVYSTAPSRQKALPRFDGRRRARKPHLCSVACSYCTICIPSILPATRSTNLSAFFVRGKWLSNRSFGKRRSYKSTKPQSKSSSSTYLLPISTVICRKTAGPILANHIASLDNKPLSNF